jgi:BlaI family penicillinase repressor
MSDRFRGAETKRTVRSPYYELSRCERKIMEAIYQLERPSAREIWQRLAKRPHYSTVRATLANLERKGYLSHDHRERCYSYRPVISREKACLQTLLHVAEVFFSRSPSSFTIGPKPE